MITLKKSFEMQNTLSIMLNQVISALSKNENITQVKQKHLKNKSYKDASDEEIIVKNGDMADITPEQLIELANVLTNEIEILATKIDKAKSFADKSFDSLVFINQKKRLLLSCYEEMKNLRSSERTFQFKDYKFNDSGEQVPYYYTVEEVTTIDYDRKGIKRRVDKLRKEVDLVSEEIDAMLLNIYVDYSPVITIGDKIEDAIEKYMIPKL